jgi:hypothetical protein
MTTNKKIDKDQPIETNGHVLDADQSSTTNSEQSSREAQARQEMSFEDAVKRTFEKNAELYRRLA